MNWTSDTLSHDTLLDDEKITSQDTENSMLAQLETLNPGRDFRGDHLVVEVAPFACGQVVAGRCGGGDRHVHGDGQPDSAAYHRGLCAAPYGASPVLDQTLPSRPQCLGSLNVAVLMHSVEVLFT